MTQINTVLDELSDGMKSILVSMANGQLTTSNLKTALSHLIDVAEKGKFS